jgi:hypothetical protein
MLLSLVIKGMKGFGSSSRAGVALLALFFRARNGRSVSPALCTEGPS